MVCLCIVYLLFSKLGRPPVLAVIILRLSFRLVGAWRSEVYHQSSILVSLIFFSFFIQKFGIKSILNYSTSYPNVSASFLGYILLDIRSIVPHLPKCSSGISRIGITKKLVRTSFKTSL
jgi:hypothetical protein